MVKQPNYLPHFLLKNRIKNDNNNKQRQTWSSRLNLCNDGRRRNGRFRCNLAFPLSVGENGGGAYVLLFCIAMIVIGIPMILVENVIGRRLRKFHWCVRR